MHKTLWHLVVGVLLVGCGVGISQGPDPEVLTVVITSPANGANVLVGDLVVSGITTGLVTEVTLTLDNDAPIVAAGTESFGATLNISAGPHTLTAVVTDADGATASHSIQLTATPLSDDETPPSLTIVSPSDGDVFATGVITLTGEASDDSALARVEVAVDGGAFETATGLTSWTFTWDASEVSLGEHTLVAAAVDLAGNRTQQTIALTLVDGNIPDVTLPVVSISAPALGSRHNMDVVVSGTASDDRSVVLVEISTNGIDFDVVGGTASWTHLLDITELDDGPVDVTVRAADHAGNVGTATRSIVLDRQAPVAVLQGLPANITSDDGLAVTVGGADVVRYRYSLDGGAWQEPLEVATTPTIAAADLADGAHTLSVIGADDLNNWQLEAAATTHSWTVDTLSPIAQLTGAPPSLTNATSFTVTVGGAHVVTYRYQLDGEDSPDDLPLVTTIEMTALDEGPHTLYVWGKSGTGVEQSSPTTVAFTVDLTHPTFDLSTPAAATLAASTALNVSNQSESATFFWTIARAACAGSNYTATGTSIVVDNTVCDGAYSVSVTATDAAGNTTSALVRNYTVDRTVPIFTLSAAPATPTNAASTDFTATTNPSESVTFNWTVTRTGTGCSNTTSSGSATSTTIAVSNTVCDGSYSLSVTATDAVGNVSSALVRVYSVDRTAPVFTLDSAPATPTNAAGTNFTATTSPSESVTFNWTVTRTGAGCSNTTSSASGTSTTIAVSNTVCDGTYSLSVTATDAVGNVSSALVRGYTVDRTAATFTLSTAPATPTNAASTDFTATTSPSESVTFNWTVTRTGAGCSNTTSSASGTSTTIAVSNAGCDGTYSLSVTATDAAGNVSSALVRGYAVDRTAPAFTLTPTNPTSPTGDAATEFTATTNPSESVTFYWSIDRSGAGCSNASDSASGTGATINVDNTVCAGTYTLTVHAEDGAGNVSAEQQRSYAILVPPPVGVAEFWGGPDHRANQPTRSTAAEWVLKRPGSDVVGYTYTLSGATSGSGTGTFSGEFARLRVTALSQGSTTVTVCLGNASGSFQTTCGTMRSVTVDTAAPASPTITSGPAQGSLQSTLTPTFDIDVPADSTLSHRVVDGGGRIFADGSGSATPLVLRALSDGSYTLSVWAVDAAGNQSTHVTRSFTVRRAPPMFGFGGAPQAYTTSSSVNVTLSNEDAAPAPLTYSYRFTGDASFSASTPFATPIVRTASSSGWQSLLVRVTDGAGNSLLREYRWFYDGGGVTRYYVAGTTGNDTNACTSVGAPCQSIQGALIKGSGDRVILTTLGSYSTTGIARTGTPFTIIGGFALDFSAWGVGNVATITHSVAGNSIACDTAPCGVVGVQIVGGGSGQGYSSTSVQQPTVIGSVFDRSIALAGDAYVEGNLFSGGQIGLNTNATFITTLLSIDSNTMTNASGVALTIGSSSTGEVAITDNDIHVPGEMGITLVNNNSTSVKPMLIAYNTIKAAVRGVQWQTGTNPMQLMLYRNELGTASLKLTDNVTTQPSFFARGIHLQTPYNYNPATGAVVVALHNSVYLQRGSAPATTCNHAGLSDVHFAFDNTINLTTGDNTGCTTYNVAGVSGLRGGAATNTITITSPPAGDISVIGISTQSNASVAQNTVTLGDARGLNITTGNSRGISGTVDSVVGNTIVSQSNGITIFAAGPVLPVRHNTFALRAITDAQGPGVNITVGTDATLDFAHNAVSRLGTVANEFRMDITGRAKIHHNTFEDVGLEVRPPGGEAAEAGRPLLVHHNSINVESGYGLRIYTTTAGGTNRYAASIFDNAIVSVTGIDIASTAVDVLQLSGNTIVADAPVTTSRPISVLANNLFVRLTAGTGGNAVRFTATPFAPGVAFANSYGRFQYALSRSSGSYTGCDITTGCTVANLVATHEGINSHEASFVDLAGGNLRLATSGNDCSLVTGGVQYEVVESSVAPQVMLEPRGLDFDELPRTVSLGLAGCAAGVSRGFSELD